MFLMWSSKLQNFIVTAVCLNPFNENRWYDTLSSETGQNFSISIRSDWSVRITLISVLGNFARRLRSVRLMLSSWYRSKVISICVLPLDDCINVGHKGLHRSKKVFKFAFFVGSLRVYPMKSIIIIHLWTVAGRDCGHFPSNNFFSSVARSELLGFRRKPSFVRK